MAAKPKNINWDEMYPEWCAGIVSLSDLSKKYGVSRPAIEKHWDKLGITRDLSAKIKAKADSLVAKSMVAKKDANERIATEKQIIDVNANIQAAITLKQRERINKHSSLCEKLFEELNGQTINKDDFVKLGELMRNEDQQSVDKLNELYRKVIATPSRVDSTKKLSETLKTLIGLERQAYGLSDNSNGEADKEPITEVVYRFVDPT